MTNEHRNRSSGWGHAKLSGHNNESLVKQLLDSDCNYRNSLLSRLGYGSESVKGISIGGLHEASVSSVLGRKTKSKTDLKIVCNSGKTINISIKKSAGGQVYLIGANSFIDVFEAQFGKRIPNDIQYAIRLFWAAAPEDALKIIQQYSDKTYLLESHHKSLNSTTLKSFSLDLYKGMLEWFSSNICEITKLSFAMGAAADPDEWSEFVWYINLLGENALDEIFNIEQIAQSSALAAKHEIYYGDKYGGTTIQLPFGFVQWHQSKLQFHHSYEKLLSLRTL